MSSKPLQPVLDVPNKLAIGGNHEIKILPPISTKGMDNDDVESLMLKCADIYKVELSEYLGCGPDDIFKNNNNGSYLSYDSRLLSYFARLQYSYDGKYLISAQAEMYAPAGGYANFLIDFTTDNSN